MRDIRGDLEDRASFLEEQIITADAQFEKHVSELRHEHKTRVEDLKDELEAVTSLIEIELRRLTRDAPAQEEQRQGRPPLEAEHQGRPPASQADSYRRPAEPKRSSRPEATEPEYRRRPAPALEAERFSRPEAAEPEYRRRPAPARESEPRRAASEAGQPRRPSPEPDRHYRPAAADAERYRRPTPAEADRHYRRPAATVEPKRRPEAEPYRQPAEHRPSSVSAPEAEHERRPAAPQVYRRPAPMAAAPTAPATERSGPVAAPSQLAPLADFLLRKLGEVGAMSFDDLCQHVTQEGYFAGGENADRGVHVELMTVVKAGFIRQLTDGTFARATVMDTIRLRRAI